MWFASHNRSYSGDPQTFFCNMIWFGFAPIEGFSWSFYSLSYELECAYDFLHSTMPKATLTIYNSFCSAKSLPYFYLPPELARLAVIIISIPRTSSFLPAQHFLHSFGISVPLHWILNPVHAQHSGEWRLRIILAARWWDGFLWIHEPDEAMDTCKMDG